MTTSAKYYGLGLRTRPVNSSRRLTPEMQERFKGRFDAITAAAHEPFKGLTTGGNAVPGLFPLQQTGVSTAPIAGAAQKLLSSLSLGQRDAVSFPLAAVEWQQWYNIHPFVVRHGLLLEDLSDGQREAAVAIMEASLSAAGYQLARDIMKLNYTIGELTGSWEEYGDWVYFLSIFGTPGDAAWGWQIDGHHLIVNCMLVGDQVVLTPLFMGSEPVIAEDGKYEGISILQAEQDVALEVVRSLDAAQRRQAVLYDSILSKDLPRERGFGPDGRIKGAAFKDNLVLPYEGIAASQLSQASRARLLDLMRLYTSRLRDEHAELWQQAVAQHLDETRFMWMGSTQDDGVFYYRIHSPVVLIEFDHQSGVAFNNEEPMRSHIHTVVRTPNGNDYGKDLLRQHYAKYDHSTGQHTPRA
jgi:hypothetical protein